MKTTHSFDWCGRNSERSRCIAEPNVGVKSFPQNAQNKYIEKDPIDFVRNEC